MIILKQVSVSGSYITAPSGLVQPGAAILPFLSRNSLASSGEFTSRMGTTLQQAGGGL
jgi:hypothetical protein